MEEYDNNGFRSVNMNQKQKVGFTSSVLMPFLSGLIGASLVVGACFGVPNIREKILGSEPVFTEATKQTLEPVDITGVSLTEYSDTAMGVADKILPSIVGITIEYEVNSFFGRSTATATGSGIIISEDGYILTNNHVVDSESTSSYYQVMNAKSIKVQLYNDETEYEATITGKDDQTDLAVIKIEKTGLKAAELGDSSKLRIGEFVMAVGSPQGLSTSVTCGVVSALNREITAESRKYVVIQTDAAINEGNSGGALVNSKGEVIGVNTLKLEGTGIEGLGFAIPINSTKEIYSQLIEHNKVLRPYIGIEGTTITPELAKTYKLVEGVYIRSVQDFSAAQKAELKVGDVITEVEGKKVTTVDEINEIKNSHQIGDTIKLKVYRNNEYKDLELTLGEQP